MNDKIRLLIAHYLSDLVSGAERSIADFVDKSNDRFEVTMLAPGDGSLADYYRQRDFEVWVRLVQTRRRKYPGLHTYQSIKMSKKLSERRITAAICNTFSAASRMGSSCRIAGIPYAIYLREYISDNRTHRKLLDQANQIFTVSKDVRDHLSSMTNPDKIQVAYNHINADRILARIDSYKNGSERRIPFGEEHPVIGMIGRIAPNKLQDLFIKAIPHVLKEVPAARFVVVGSAYETDRAYDKRVKNLVGKLGIQGKIAFMGYRIDALEINSELTITCVPSLREPLGRVILESQVIGTPVVASDTGGTPEIVKDGITGMQFSIKGADVEEHLANTLIQLLSDGKLRAKLSRNSQEFVMGKFCSLDHVRQLESHIMTMIEREAVVIGAP